MCTTVGCAVQGILGYGAVYLSGCEKGGEALWERVGCEGNVRATRVLVIRFPVRASASYLCVQPWVVLFKGFGAIGLCI